MSNRLIVVILSYNVLLFFLRTFCQCLDGIKSTLKLQNLGESLPELCADEQHIDLCRCLYKLHFQLSLLYDTYAKFLVAMLHAARIAQVRNRDIV